MDATIEKMIHVMSSIHKLQLSVKELEDSNELTVSYVKRMYKIGRGLGT